MASWIRRKWPVCASVSTLDGVIDREEADFLFAVNDAVSGRKNAPGWKKLFVEALTDYVLCDEVSPGVVDDKEAAYLIKKIQGDKQVDEVELALLVNITAKAKGTPPKFQKFVLASLKDAILEDGVIDADEVNMIKTRLSMAAAAEMVRLSAGS